MSACGHDDPLEEWHGNALSSGSGYRARPRRSPVRRRSACGRRPSCRAPRRGSAKHAILPVPGPKSRADPVPRTARPDRRRSARRRPAGRSPPASAPRSALPMSASSARAPSASASSPLLARDRRAASRRRRCRAPRPRRARTERAGQAPASAAVRRFAAPRESTSPRDRRGTGKNFGCVLSGTLRMLRPALQLDQPVGLALRRALRQRQAARHRETPPRGRSA